MNKQLLEIRTDSGWQTAVIDEDVSISINFTSPLWEDEIQNGAYSYSFPLNVPRNLHLFGNSGEIHGETLYAIDRKSFRLYANGTILLTGIIRMDDEVSIDEDGNIDIELASSNQEFSDLIDNMNCQDVEVKDNICVGTEISRIDVRAAIKNYGEIKNEYYSVEIPGFVFSLNEYKTADTGGWVNTTNVSQPYPEKKYCNVRVCVQYRKKKKDGTYEATREYEVFEADRPNSGVCFYVMYFLDCLFHQLEIPFDNTALRTMEDMNRLAFFTTQCKYDLSPMPTEIGLSDEEFRQHFQTEILTSCKNNSSDLKLLSATHLYHQKYKYANSKNFPDEDVEGVLEALTGGFGIRFIFDSASHTMKAVYLKDVLRDASITDLSAKILSVEKQEEKVDGIIMSYGGNEDDTSYNYDVMSSTVVPCQGYETIRAKGNNAFDKNAYYDISTGNLYRIKVDEDAEKEEELYPSLFEVGQYGDVWAGDKDGESILSIDVGFTPVSSNIIEYTSEGESTTSGRSSVTQQSTSGSTQPKYAIFIDKEITAAETNSIATSYTSAARKGSSGRYSHLTIATAVQYTSRYGYSDDYIKSRNKYYGASAKKVKKAYMKDGRIEINKVFKISWGKAGMNWSGSTVPIPKYTEDPFQEFDAGLTLGVMRGPGNDSGIEHFDKDYDSEGNWKYQYVSTDYNFLSDSIDHYGHLFDYNGTSSGGLDYTGRFSLKLRGEKRKAYTEEIHNNSVTVKTKSQAEFWLSILYPGASANLLDQRVVLGNLINAHGWPAELGKHYAIYPVLRDITVNGATSTYLMNVIIPTGDNVLSPSELTSYIEELSTGEEHINGLGRDYYSLIIKKGATEEDLERLTGLMNVYYFHEQYPSYTIRNISREEVNAYLPISSGPGIAKRGLFDTFYSEYSYFVLNRKTVSIECKMEAAELSRIDMTKRYRIGNYVGFIKKLSYSLSNDEGLSDIKIEMYYI